MTSMSKSSESVISITNAISFGMYAKLTVGTSGMGTQIRLPDMAVKQTVTTSFTFEDDGEKICLQPKSTHRGFGVVDNWNVTKWEAEKYEALLFGQSVQHLNGFCWTSSKTSDKRSNDEEDSFDDLEVVERENDQVSQGHGQAKKEKRQNNSFPSNGDYRGLDDIPDLTYLINKQVTEKNSRSWRCVGGGCSYSCYIDYDTKGDCCSCVWIPPDNSKQAYDVSPGMIPGSMNPPGTIPGGISPPALLTGRGILEDKGGSIPGLDRSIRGRSVLERLAEDMDSTSPAIELHARSDADISKGLKDLTFWYTFGGWIDLEDTRAHVVQTDPYPQYPNWYMNPTGAANWESAPSYRDIPKYFHNSSDSCTSFDVDQFSSWDRMYPWPKRDGNGQSYTRGKAYHALYNTEHIFEAQTVVRFFDKWLSEKAAIQRNRYWVEQYVLWTQDAEWEDADGDIQPFIHPVADQLGSVNEQQRLSIFMQRPNEHKGRLFRDVRAMGPGTFNGLSAGAEQLLAVREIGLIFPYMNHDTIWQGFCATYNAILDLMVRFDAWYQGQTGATSQLADEWPKFVRSELDMVVKRARDNIKELHSLRVQNISPVYARHWTRIMSRGGEMSKVKLDRVDHCRGLPGTGVPAWTG